MPIGKTLTIHGKYYFIVVGVIKNIPSNSSFQFDAFISDEFLNRYLYPNEDKKWNSMGVETYVQFSPAISPQYLKSQFTSLLNKYLPDYLKGRLKLDIQPLQDIHTNIEIESRLAPQVSKSALLIFFIIACTILVIASINFINITTSLFVERQKEIGIRKIVGANRIQLIQQLLCESILMTFCALLLGYILLQFMLPYFNNYIQQPISYKAVNNISFVSFAVIFSLTLGLINGIYPSLILSAQRPLTFLRKEHKKILGLIRIRYLPVTIQFGITIALILCVITISNQVSFMKNHDLGFSSNNLISIPVEVKTMEDYRNVKLYVDVLKNEGLTHGIQSAAFSENVPGSFFPNGFKIIPEGVSNDKGIEMVVTRSVSDDFLPTCKMNIVDGRNFSKNMSTDFTDAAIINQTAAKMLGWNNPIGKRIRFSFDSHYFTIIGVIKDIHFKSLQNKIEPLVFTQYGAPMNNVIVRINPGDFPNTISYLKQQWNNILSASTFKYDFVDDMYRENYKKEEKLLKAISTFATLAIILASLGLFGLTVLIALRRTKEIGIRKTLGATVSNIVFLMSKELIFWVIAANILAVPVAVYFMNKWLQNFPYRIELSWWIMMLSGLIALVIALVTVSVNAIKAATANPVEALRYE